MHEQLQYLEETMKPVKQHIMNSRATDQLESKQSYKTSKHLHMQI